MKFLLLLFTILHLATLGVLANEEAIRECGDVLHEDIHKIPNFRGEFVNDRCQLKCYSGNVEISSNNINEGFACEPATKGICRLGHCVSQQNDAVKECSKLHNFDFSVLKNAGTAFTNDECSLKCVIDGKVISNKGIHENAHCPTNPSGVCHKGQCDTTGKPVTDNPNHSTKPTPTHSTPIDTSGSIEEIEVTILKATLLEDFTDQEVSVAILVHAETDCRSDAVKYSGSPIEFTKKCSADKIKTKSTELYLQLDYHMTDETAIGGFYSESLVELLKRLHTKSPSQNEFEETFELHNIALNNVQKHTASVLLKISFKLHKN